MRLEGMSEIQANPDPLLSINKFQCIITFQVLMYSMYGLLVVAPNQW